MGVCLDDLHFIYSLFRHFQISAVEARRCPFFVLRFAVHSTHQPKFTWLLIYTRRVLVGCRCVSIEQKKNKMLKWWLKHAYGYLKLALAKHEWRARTAAVAPNERSIKVELRFIILWPGFSSRLLPQIIYEPIKFIVIKSKYLHSRAFRFRTIEST